MSLSRQWIKIITKKLGDIYTILGTIIQKLGDIFTIIVYTKKEDTKTTYNH
jgi:hypothetical protein